MLEPELGIMVWTLVTFAVLFLVLRRYAFDPLRRVVEQRRDSILQAIRAAEEDRRKYEEMLADNRRTIAEARQEAEEIIERARRAGETARSEIVAQARAQSQREVERAREQIRRETRLAVQEIRDQMADLTVMAAAKVAAGAIDARQHQRLVDEALAGIDFEKLGYGEKQV